MKEIKKIDVWTASRISAIITAIIGLVATAIGIILVKYLDPVNATEMTVAAISSTLLIAIVLYGLVGFLGTALYVWLYNLLTKYMKGIEVEIK